MFQILKTFLLLLLICFKENGWIKIKQRPDLQDFSYEFVFINKYYNVIKPCESTVQINMYFWLDALFARGLSFNIRITHMVYVIFFTRVFYQLKFFFLFCIDVSFVLNKVYWVQTKLHNITLQRFDKNFLLFLEDSTFVGTLG